MEKDMETHGQQLHAQGIVIDGTMVIFRDYEPYLHKILQGGVTGIVLTLVANEGFMSAIRSIYEWYGRIERTKDISLLVEKASDIERAKREGKVGVLFAFQSGSPIEDDIRLLEIFKKLGLRVMSLTYNERNLIGDGCAERTNCGLSDFGVEVVREMNRLGIVIDLSHCGEQTTIEAIELSTKPVLISHSNAKALCDHPRNVSDATIKALADKGGVVGINAFPYFLRKDGKATLQDFLNHIDYVTKRAGVDHVAVGSDIAETKIKEDYMTKDGQLGFGKTKYKPEMIPPWPWILPAEIDSVLKFSNLTKGLIQRGYSDDDVLKILGGNYVRVFKEIF
ncbi:MAG: dipeptidase [Desulfobacterales bacterium]|jgi:membrane dipeptidase|nr:dipeptidase [Desulfobacterales bacterium]